MAVVVGKLLKAEPGGGFGGEHGKVGERLLLLMFSCHSLVGLVGIGRGGMLTPFLFNVFVIFLVLIPVLVWSISLAL